MASAQRIPAIPSKPHLESPEAMREFARRLGEVAAVISPRSWEEVEPMLAALWGDADDGDWEAMREVARHAWTQTRRLY